MLCQAYAAAKAANPDVQILAGALAPTLAPVGSEWGLNDLDYLQGMYDAGASRALMCWRSMLTGGPLHPMSQPVRTPSISTASSSVREIMVRNGDGDKHISITEGAGTITALD